MTRRDPDLVRVLVIDDDDNTRTALIDLLSHAGFGVWGASDHDDACEQLEQLQPDVAIVEARMVCVHPDGLLRCVRERAPHALLIATGDLGRGNSGVGADLILAHPIDVDALLTYLEKFRAAG